MAINKNHEFEELDGVKCGIVEKNVSASRAEFLKSLLVYNGYTVVIVPSPPPKVVPPKAAPVARPAVTEVASAEILGAVAVPDPHAPLVAPPDLNVSPDQSAPAPQVPAATLESTNPVAQLPVSVEPTAAPPILIASGDVAMSTSQIAAAENPVPETFTVGVTDYTFNPINAIFGRLLQTPDKHVVTLAYWQQEEEISRDEIPYYQATVRKNFEH